MRLAFLVPDNREHHRRYDVTVPYFGTAPEALLQGLAQIPKLEVHVVTCTQKPMRSPKKLAENIYFHSLLVPKIGWLRTGYQGCVRATRRKLRELQPDMVHGQGTERDSALAAALSGFPNVITIHGNMQLVAKINHARPLTFYWCAAIVERFTLPRVDGVVCISNYTREAVQSSVSRTWVVPNAVDESFFCLRPRERQTPLVVCAGTICVRKNQNFLITALDGLAKEQPFELVFLGEGLPSDPYVAEFHELVASRPWCRHMGFLNRSESQKLLEEAALLILPSLEDNCPMVILEAMAAGVPVAAAAVGGIPDLIEPGVTGLLFDPCDKGTIHQAVEALLNDQEAAQRLSAAALRQAHERFLPEVVAKRHVEIYRELLAGSGRLNQNTKLSANERVLFERKASLS